MFFSILGANMSHPNYVTSRAILSTQNDCKDKINLKMINLLHGDKMVYHSFDSAMDDPRNYYPSKFLNTLTPNRYPTTYICWSSGLTAPIILLRNINPTNDFAMARCWWFEDFEKCHRCKKIAGSTCWKEDLLAKDPALPLWWWDVPFSLQKEAVSY